MQNLKKMISNDKVLADSKNLNFQSVSTKLDSYRTGAFTTHENSTWVNDGYMNTLNDRESGSSSVNDCPGTPISFSSGFKMVTL